MTILLIRLFSLGICYLIDMHTLAKVGIRPSLLHNSVNLISNGTFSSFVLTFSKDRNAGKDIPCREYSLIISKHNQKLTSIIENQR